MLEMFEKNRIIMEEHKQTIDNHISKIRIDNYQNVLSTLYKYIKSITDFYYDQGLIYIYDELKKRIITAEMQVQNEKIIDIPIHFDLNDSYDGFIEFIVQNTRAYLIRKHTSNDGQTRNINDINLSGDCELAAENIQYLCEQNHFEQKYLIIHPGYMEKANLYNGNGYHYANIVKYNNKYYLVDVTYSQFFYANQNNLNRIGIMKLSNCNVGTFALMNKTRKKVAISLLKNGYIELNEDTFKAYLDPFTISSRNGLYYENTNDFSYTTTYTVDDYIQFLKGKDNQINHEGRENLGYQKRPLQNWNLNFTRRMD